MSSEQEDKKKAEDLQLYDDEVQEVIHRVPHWLVRIGATLLLVVITIVLIVAWMIRYPDIIVADMKITTENPPAYISSYTTGKIEQLWVRNNQDVKQGEPLLVLENPARYDDVMFVRQTIRQTDDPASMWEHFKGRNPQLGELQSSYNRLYKSLSDYIHYRRLAKIPAQMRTIEQELAIYKALHDHQRAKIEAQREDYRLATKQYQRDSLLYSNEVLSDAEWDQATQRLLEKRIALRNAVTELDQMELSAAEKRSALQELSLRHRENITGLQQTIHDAWQELLADIAIWQKNYLIIAPIDGTVSFAVYLEKNMTVRANAELMSVIPEERGDIIGKVNISFQGAGKVQPGQHVNIKLSDYPYLEFGIIPGRLESLSQVAGEHYYVGIVNLPQGLITNSDLYIEYKQDMTGQAEIITNNIRFLERILNPLEALRKIQEGYKQLEQKN